MDMDLSFSDRILERLQSIARNNPEALHFCSKPMEEIRAIATHPSFDRLSFHYDVQESILENLVYSDEILCNSINQGLYELNLIVPDLLTEHVRESHDEFAQEFIMQSLPFFQEFYAKMYETTPDQFLDKDTRENLLDLKLDEIANGSADFDRIILFLRDKYSLDTNSAKLDSPDIQSIYDGLRAHFLMQPEAIIENVELKRQNQLQEEFNQEVANFAAQIDSPRQLLTQQIQNEQQFVNWLREEWLKLHPGLRGAQERALSLSKDELKQQIIIKKKRKI